MRSRLCASQRAVLSQAWRELVLQILNGIRPLEWLGGLVVAGNKVENGRSEFSKAGKMVRLQKFALQNAEPYFDLIEPRCIDREPVELDGKWFIWLGR